jgi:hypothetical protein
VTSRSEPKPVLVQWIDSTSFGQQRWRDLEEGEKLAPATIRSVGFLLHSAKDHIRITGHLDDGDNESGCFVIPRGCIKRIRRLK